MNARLPGIVVPDGFTVPFYYYDEFIKRNKLDDVIFGLLNDQKFVHDPAYRREQLVLLRQKIESAEFSPELRRAVLQKVAHEYAGKGLFVASSS
jgi:phosphoenolpyruvate synthase/pyruvate phosphate dikinase